MIRIQRILLLFFAVVGIAHTECRHTKQNRNVKLDICKECKELLNETISPAFKDLKNFSRCLENKSDSVPVLSDLDEKPKVTEEELSKKLPEYIIQLKYIKQAWEVHNLPVCSHNLKHSLTRIMCLVRGGSKRKSSCVSKQRTKKPKPGKRHVRDFTDNYIREVYSTLHGFVKNL